MPRSQFVLVLLSAAGLVGCAPSPEPATSAGARPSADSAEPENMPFRAHVTYAEGAGVPVDARLVAYVVEGDFEEGERRIVAQLVVPAPQESPVEILLEVPRTELRADLGYLLYVAMTDSEGRLLMSTPMNRPPVPATALYLESTFGISLQPVFTPVAPEQALRLPDRLSFRCADLEIAVRQLENNDVILTTPEGDAVLRPAVATSGGRFSDGATELWLTDEQQAFLIMPGVPPRPCTMHQVGEPVMGRDP